MATTLQFDIIARDLASRTFNKIGAKSGVLSKTFAGFGAVATGALKGATLAVGAFGAVAAKTGLETAASLERAQISFEQFTGSASTASDLIEKIKKFTLSTPFELPGLVETSKRLLGVGVSAKDLLPTISALGDTAAAYALNGEQFNRVTLAISQSLAKGRFQQEEFNQVSEAGIPILKILSRAMDLPIPKLLELSRTGDLLASDVFPKLLTQMRKDYGGAMAKQVNTLTGLWSNLVDALRIGASDALEPLIPIFKSALPEAGQQTFAMFRHVRDGLQFFVDVLIPAIGQITDFGNAMVNKLVPIDAIKGKLADAGKAVRDFFIGLSGTRIPGAQDMMEHIFDPKKSGAEKFGDRIRELLSGGIQDAIKGLSAEDVGEALGTLLGKAIDFLARNAAAIGGKIGDILGDIDWVDVGEAVGSKAFGFAIGFASGLFSELADPEFWKKHWDEVAIALLTAGPVGKIAGVLGRVAGKIPVLKAFEPLLRGIDKLTGPIQKALGGVFRFAVGSLGFFAKNVLTGIGNVFGKKNLGDTVAKWFSAIPTAIGVARITITEKLRGMITALGDVITNKGGVVSRAIGTVIGFIIKPFADAGSWLKKAGGKVIDGLRSGVTKAFPAVTEWFRKVRGKVVAALGAANKWLVEKGRNTIGGFWKGVVERAKGIGQAVKDLIKNKVIPAFSKAGSWLVSAGRAVVGGLLSGLRARLQEVKDLAARIAEIVRGAFGGSPAEYGPLKETPPKQSGEHIIEDLRKGIAIGAKPLAGEMARIAGGLSLPMGIGMRGSGGGTTVVHVTFSGPVGSSYELRNWLVRAIDDANRHGRLSGISAS